MALTLEAEQRMIDAGVIKFYEDNASEWFAAVLATKRFVADNFPPDAPIRRDDVAKVLFPIVEVHEAFKEFRNANKLRGKFWIKDFSDLLIDRTWDRM